MKVITGNTSSTPGGQFRKQHTHSQQEWVQQKYRRSRERWLTLNETSTVTKRNMIFIHLLKQTKCSYFNMLFILLQQEFLHPLHCSMTATARPLLARPVAVSLSMEIQPLSLLNLSKWPSHRWSAQSRLDRLWSPWQQLLSQQTMARRSPYLFKVQNYL